MTYNVIISWLHPSTSQETLIQGVSSYEMQRDRVFYVAGSDFEQWIALKKGQTVSVTEEIWE
jgi:hypothetical protein